MCLNTNKFKLCSCSVDQLPPDEIGWKLTRVNKDKSIRKIMGKPFIPTIPQHIVTLKTHITEQLNIRNCFDFDYSPLTQDRLSIKVANNDTTWVHFIYEAGKWKIDTSTKFNTWRQQSEPYHNGKVNC